MPCTLGIDTQKSSTCGITPQPSLPLFSQINPQIAGECAVNLAPFITSGGIDQKSLHTGQKC